MTPDVLRFLLGFNFLGDGLRDLTDPKRPQAATPVQP